MKTLSAVAATLRAHLSRTSHTQQSLATAAGVSRQTLSNVLSGRSDFKVTTLLSLADRLGLELVLLPKEVARGLSEARTDAEPQPAIQSRVQSILQAVQQAPHDSRKNPADRSQTDSGKK